MLKRWEQGLTPDWLAGLTLMQAIGIWLSIDYARSFPLATPGPSPWPSPAQVQNHQVQNHQVQNHQVQTTTTTLCLGRHCRRRYRYRYRYRRGN
ncbi:hypothetical protein B0H65DRAFT_77132 [Neurospora tetraspora]|uniref:Uncharacterized protein n=1 Tax=Neurospora tetraspora TaxID=94610 RepID=A0AAE0J143_9PEZI|nr:hypothetical protein B0H65DRAFT_77132 [Neurospora tetraspora]